MDTLVSNVLRAGACAAVVLCAVSCPESPARDPLSPIGLRDASQTTADAGLQVDSESIRPLAQQRDVRGGSADTEVGSADTEVERSGASPTRS